MRDLGGSIRAAYKAKGWRQEDFANAVNAEMAAKGLKSCVKTATVTAWCSLTPAMLESIATALGNENFFEN
jgi:hypothetical protein